MRHSRIQRDLYDYVHGGLEEKRRAFMEKHLQRCPMCAEEMASLRKVTVALPPGSAADDAMGEDFWKEFADRVGRRLPATPRKHASPLLLRADAMARILLRPAVTVGMGLALTVAVAGLLLMKPLLNLMDTQDSRISSGEVRESLRADSMQSILIGDYLRRSEALLVGLTNIPEDPDEAEVEYAAEQRASLRLLREARVLRAEAGDMRSEELLTDMEKVFLKLANAEGRGEDLELVRHGIERTNLLFRIRMTGDALRPAVSRASWQPVP